MGEDHEAWVFGKGSSAEAHACSPRQDGFFLFFPGKTSEQIPPKSQSKFGI